MEDYSKYSAEELESMLGEYDAASKSAQTPESTATVMKPQGIKQRKVDLGEFLKLGQENKSGSSLDDLYGDGAASELIGTYAAITPFSGTAASMNANHAIRQLQDSIKTGEVPFNDVKGADTVGGFVKAFLPFTKGVVGKAADEWDAKEGAKYDLYERAANGEDVDASSLVKRAMGNDGRYRPIVDEDGNVQLDEKYAGGKDAKDAARKEFVKGFSSRMLEQYAATMDAAEKERASDVSPWYSLMVKYGAEQIPFTTEMFMGSSAMRAASASGRLGSTAQTIAEALNNGEKVANVSRTARAAYKLGELSVPAIIGAADRYERLRANDVAFDENGDMVIKDNARGVAEATAMAAAGGLTNVILEEYTNKAVGGLLKWTGGKAARFPGIGPKFVEFFKKHGGDKAKNYVLDFMKGYEKIAQRTKFGLPVGEFTEEYVQDIADKVVGLDAKEGERKSFMDFSGDFFTWDSNLKELTLGILGMTLLQGGGAHFMERGNRVVKSFDGRVTGTLKAAGIDGSMMSPSHRIAAAIQVNPDLNKELDFSLDEIMRMNGVTWSEIDKMTPQEKRAAMSVMGQVYANGGAEELAKRLDKTMQGVVNDMDAQALLDGNWRNVESAKNRQSRATWVTVADKAGNIIWNTDEETGKKYVQDAAVGARIYDNGDGTFRAYHPEIGFTKSFNEMADAADWISAMDKAAQERAEIRDKKKQYVQTIAERIAPERKGKDGKTYGANVVAYNTMEDALNDDGVSDADKNEIAKVMSKGGASGVMLSDGRVAVFVDEMKTIGDALYTVIHELGHVGLREGTKGNAKGASLAQTIENAWRGTSAYKTPNADSEQKEEDVVENNERAIAHANPVRRAVAAVKQFVNENLGGKLELTDNDYNAIVESGVRRIEKRGGMENTPSNFFNTKKELGDVAFVRTEEGNKMVALKEKSAWISDYRAQKEALDAARAEIDYIKAQTDRAEEENRQAKKDEANAEWMEKEIERREEAKRREEEEKRQIADAEHATKYGRQMVADALEGWYGVGSYGKNGIKPEQINRIVKGATDEEISELLDFLEIEAGGKASDGTFLEAAKNVNLAIARRTVSEKQEANRKNLANRAKTESADRKTAERKLVEKFVNDVQMNTNSILAFWLNNGKKLLNHPQAKLIANKGRGKGFRYVFSGKEVDSEALNAFFDGKHGEERAKWKRIVFGENYKPAKDGDVVGNDVKNGDWIEFKHGASGFDKYNDAEGIMSDEDFNDFGSMLEQLRKEYSEYEEWKNGDQLTAEEQRIKDEIERENKRIDEENAEIDSAREAWDGAIAMTSDGKPISSPSEMKVGDVTTIGNAAEGELRLEVIGRDGDVIQFACNDNPMFEGEVFSLKWNNEKGDWDEVQQKADEGGQDRDRREVAGDAEQDGSSGREEGRGNGSGDGAEAGGRAATEEARNADDANALKLESATAADIAAENKRIADRAEIARRQSAPLKGGSMEVGQTLMDLGGAEGEDLFNRTEVSGNETTKTKEQIDEFVEKAKSLLKKSFLPKQMIDNAIREGVENFKRGAKRGSLIYTDIGNGELPTPVSEAAYAVKMARSAKLDAGGMATGKSRIKRIEEAENKLKSVVYDFKKAIADQSVSLEELKEEANRFDEEERDIIPQGLDAFAHDWEISNAIRDEIARREGTEAPPTRDAINPLGEGPWMKSVRNDKDAIALNNRYKKAKKDEEIKSIKIEFDKLVGKHKLEWLKKNGISEDTHRKLGKAGEVLLDAALSKGTFETRWRKVIDNGFKEKTEDEIVRELRADKFNDGETRKVGAQSIVYRQGDKVVKLRDVDGDVVDALRKIEQFNDLFPDMKYEVRMESVKDNGGKTRIVIEQPYVDALPNSGTEARKQLVEQLKERFGAENVTTRGDVNEKKLLSPKSWFKVEAGPWKIEDLKDLNLGIDKNDGKVKVWDAEVEYDANEAKPKKTLFRRNSPVTSEEDAAYMDAVKRGDMETARRMVRMAAASAMPNTKVVDKDGLPLVVYHGSYTHGFTEFNRGKEDVGIFFTPQLEAAKEYGMAENTYSVFLDVKNPVEIDWMGDVDNDGGDNHAPIMTEASYARENGNDGLIALNTFDGENELDQYCVFNPSQIKSADPVTYDDDDNVIPLSERFNLEKSDIRWRRNRQYSPNVNAQRLADVYKLTSAESRAYVKMQRMLGADDYQSLVKAVREVQIQGSVNAENKGLLDAINNGDKTKVLDDLKRGTESVIVRNWKKFLKIKLQDAMTSVKQMEDALGIKKEDSVYYQFDRNYGLEQEHLDALNREVMVPLRDEMAALEKKHNRKIKSHKIVTKNGVATQQEEYHEETAYGLLNMLLMAKHGPNRNRMMAERSPYVLEAMTNKATKQIIDDVLNGVRDLDEATVKQIAANLGWSGEKLTRLEKGLSGSGASTAFWNKWMKDHAQFAADADKARRLVLKMNQMTRDVLVKSGRMSAAQAKEWERLSPDYVPLRSDMDVDSSIFAKLFLGGNGSGVASGAEGHKYTDNEFHHAFGRNDIADDAIAFSQQQYMEAVKRALDNDARRKLAATVRKNPNLGNVIMLLSEAERADIAKRVAILKNTFQKRGLTPQELDALVKMTRKLAEDRIGQGFIPTQRILGANGVYYDIPNVKGLERNEKNKNDTRTPFIAFKEDGELKFIMLGGFSQREINANPALLSDSDAKEIATQVKKQNLFRSNFASGLRKWTGWFSAMRTAYSPYFMATNLLADRSQAKRNIDATFGSEGVKKFRHYAFNSFGAARAVLDYKKIVDPATGETRYERVFDNNSNVQKYAKEWAENGGRIAGMAIENIRELRDGIRYNIRNAGSVKDRWNRTDVKDPKSMLAFLNDMRVRGSDVVEYANSVVEMSTRIAAYATARDMGMSIADAVSYSRDVTVNFNRKGELTPFINAWWAFSNASIQDFSRSMEAFGEGEYVNGSLILGKRGAKMALKLAIWGFLASLVGIGQDDPEDEAEGEKQYKYNKEWEKANKMGVRIGDFTVGVPIRGLSRVPYYFGQKMAEVMFTNKRTTSAALDVAKLVFDTGYDVVGGSPTLAQAISPSVMKPLVELWENKDFTGKQIYTEDVFGKGFAKSEMGRSSTSDEAKAVARFVNWITGGDRGKSGKIDLHPEVYEKLLDWAGGTAMRDVAQTAGFVKDLATFNIANRNVRNMPLVSRFIRSVGENSSDFYEKRAEYDKAKTHHAKMADIGDAESMREDENEMPWLSKRGSGKRWGDALKDKESEIKKLLKAEKTLEGEDKELAHKLRLKSQYQFMRRLETAPKDDAEGVKAERDHKRAAMPLIRKATKMLEDAERKRKRLERGL